MMVVDVLNVYEELKEVMDDRTASKLAKILNAIQESKKSEATNGDLKHILEEQNKSQKDIRDIKTDLHTLTNLVVDIAKTQRETTIVVKELADAQKRTEQRVEELSGVQKRSEERIGRLEEVVRELAEVQKRSEERLSRLEEVVRELAEAQKRTEQRVEELSGVQKRSEERIGRLEEVVRELAEAQKRTEESLNRLIKRVDNMEDQLGGLSSAVGYGLEDRMYPHIYRFVKKVYGIEPEELRLRKHLIYEDGRYDELNIFIRGEKDGIICLVLGECKAQPGKKDIDRFMKVVERVERYYGAKVYPFIIGYIFQPSIDEYIKETYTNLKYHMTYEIEYEQY